MAFLILYFTTASPSIGWRDGPELTSTTNSLGIAHPAGFPTYSLLTKVMTYFPLGSIPFRITLGTALFAVGALWILYKLIEKYSWMDASSRDAETYSTWAAAGTAVAFGLTTTLWINTTENEVYTLNLLFVGLILYCTIKWSSGEGDKWLYAGGLLYGLAAGNHGTVALYAPGFLTFFLIRAGSDRWRLFLFVLFFFLVGFSVYLYLPIRSIANPPIDFGNPETWQRFLMHVTDRKDSTTHFADVRDSTQFLRYASAFAQTAAPWWFWPFVLPLVILGLWRTAKTNIPLAGLIIYIFFINILFFLRWTRALSNFLPIYFLTAYLAGIGLTWVLRSSHFLFSFPRLRTTMFTFFLALLFIGGTLIGYRYHDRSGNFLSYELFRTNFEVLPPDSIILVTVLWFSHITFQDIYRMRDDVTVVLESDFSEPELFTPITPDRFPRIKVPSVTDEQGHTKVPFQNFVDENAAEGRHIYVEPIEHTSLLYRNLIPGPNFLMEFRQEQLDGLSNELVQRIFNDIREGLSENIENLQIAKETQVGAYYFHYLINLTEYLKRHGRFSDSISIYMIIVELFGPDGLAPVSSGEIAVTYNDWATSLFALGRIDEAISRVELAIEIIPEEASFLFNMGQFLYEKGEKKRAEEFLLKSLAIEEINLTFLFLGKVKESYGQLDEASRYYQKALAMTEKRDLRESLEKKLETLRNLDTQ